MSQFWRMAKQGVERLIAWAQDCNTKGTQIKVRVVFFYAKIVLWFGSGRGTRDDSIDNKSSGQKRTRGPRTHRQMWRE